jgi:hypothetical protein
MFFFYHDVIYITFFTESLLQVVNLDFIFFLLYNINTYEIAVYLSNILLSLWLCGLLRFFPFFKRVSGYA